MAAVEMTAHKYAAQILIIEMTACDLTGGIPEE